MNTVYITLDSVSNPIVRSQVIEYLIYLSGEFKITLISFEGEKDKHAFELVDNLLAENNITWHRVPYSNKYNFISIGWSLFISPFKIYPLLKKNNVKIVHARSMLPAAISLLLSKFLKFKVIYDIRGFWVDEKADIGRIKKNGFLYRILHKLDGVVYRKSQAVVTVARRSVDLIIEKYSIPLNKISVITNTVSMSTFPAILDTERNNLRKSMGFTEKDIVLVHAGSIRGYYDFSLELKIFKELLQLNSCFKFLILNKKEDRWARSQFEQFGFSAEQYVIINSEFSEVYKYLNLADFSFFLIVPTYSKLAAFPVKFAESIATNLPVISNAGVGDTEDYLSRFNVGLCLNYQDIKCDPKNGANQIYTWIKSYEKDQNEFQKLIDQHLNKRIAYHSYQKIYRSLLANKTIQHASETEVNNV